MSDDSLAELSYLWDGSDPGWVLLKAPDLQGGYCVFHKINRTLLLIERSSTNEAVCKKMKETGCEILEDLPPENDEATVSAD